MQVHIAKLRLKFYCAKLGLLAWMFSLQPTRLWTKVATWTDLVMDLIWTSQPLNLEAETLRDIRQKENWIKTEFSYQILFISIAFNDV